MRADPSHTPGKGHYRKTRRCVLPAHPQHLEQNLPDRGLAPKQLRMAHSAQAKLSWGLGCLAGQA